MTLYYNNSIVTEDDYPELSEKFRIPYDLVAEVIAQMQEDGEPRWASYTGTVREKIRQMFEAIKDRPDDQETDPMPLSENADIVNQAAISLIQAMSSNEAGSFIITNDGVCTINRACPPTLTASYEVVAKVVKLRELGPRLDDKTSWMLGSIIYELEELHGEDFNIGQIVDQTEKSYNTIWQMRETYKNFRDKRYNLPYSHHKEIMFIDIPNEHKHLVLHKAELCGLTSKHVRELGKIIRDKGDVDSVKAIRSMAGALKLIEQNKKESILYIVLNDGVMNRVRGTADAIPTGKMVIDTKNWTVRANNGTPVEIPIKK